MLNNNYIRTLLFNCWEGAPDEVKQDLRVMEYRLELLEKIATLFEWSGLPEGVEETTLEKLLAITGCISLDKIGEEYYLAWCQFRGILNKRGYSDQFLHIYLDGETAESKLDDTAYCFNNNIAFPDRLMIERYSEMFANIDLSMVYNIIYSRNLPVPIVSDDSEKAQIEEVINNALDGKVKVVSTDLLRKIAEGSDGSIPLLNIFNVQATQNMQDLSRCHEDILKRIMEEYGIDINVRDKKAQTNNAEVNAFDTYAQLTIKDKLRMREDFCKRANELYGLNISVKIRDYIEDDYEEGGEVEDEEKEQSEVEGADRLEAESDREEASEPDSTDK